MKIAKPDRESNPDFYRKGYYAIPVQAVCDSAYVLRYESELCGVWHNDIPVFAFHVHVRHHDYDTDPNPRVPRTLTPDPYG